MMKYDTNVQLENFLQYIKNETAKTLEIENAPFKMASIELKKNEAQKVKNSAAKYFSLNIDNIIDSTQDEVFPSIKSSSKVVKESKNDKLSKLSRLLILKNCPTSLRMATNLNCFACEMPVYSSNLMLFCYYSHRYFCSMCHQKFQSIIPGNVIERCDFKKYPVCAVAFKYLSKALYCGLISQEMIPESTQRTLKFPQVEYLRDRLCNIADVVQGCTPPVQIPGHATLRPREMSEKFSVEYLRLIYQEKLFTTYSSIFEKYCNHIKDCVHCSSVNILCYYCKKPTLSYPYGFNNCSMCSNKRND